MEVKQYKKTKAFFFYSLMGFYALMLMAIILSALLAFSYGFIGLSIVLIPLSAFLMFSIFEAFYNREARKKRNW